MYSVNKDLSTVTKTHILQTNFNGSNGLAMHAIDDILAIHDRYANKKKYQKKKSSYFSTTKFTCPLINGSFVKRNIKLFI